MPPSAIPLIAQAGDLIAHPGLLQAVGITLAAPRPIRAAAAAKPQAPGVARIRRQLTRSAGLEGSVLFIPICPNE